MDIKFGSVWKNLFEVGRSTHKIARPKYLFGGRGVFYFFGIPPSRFLSSHKLAQPPYISFKMEMYGHRLLETTPECLFLVWISEIFSVESIFSRKLVV